jgi:hypothetical protein
MAVEVSFGSSEPPQRQGDAACRLPSRALTKRNQSVMLLSTPSDTVRRRNGWRAPIGVASQSRRDTETKTALSCVDIKPREGLKKVSENFPKFFKVF